METITHDLFLTPAELASICDVSVQWLYKMLKEHEIQTRVIGNRHKIYPRDMRKFLEAKKLPIPTGVFTVHVVKGGVGKTTLVHGLASRASTLGLRTLMIDLDQQANLSSSFGIYTTPKKDPTLVEVHAGNLNGKVVTIRDVIHQVTDFLHIIPANLNVANLDIQLMQGTENIGSFFRDLIQPVRHEYDLIFFDCPPSLSRVSTAAQCYADQIVIPVNIDRFSIDGLELTLDHLSSIQQKFRLKTELHIVINKFDARQKILGNAVVGALVEKYKDLLAESYISISKQIENCIAAHQCIWSARSPRNHALEDMGNLLSELLHIDQWKMK